MLWNSRVEQFHGYLHAKSGERVVDIGGWESIDVNGKFPSGKVSRELMGDKENVAWRKVLFGNKVRTRAAFVLRLACHGRLTTKNRLQRMGVLNDGKWFFGDNDESVEDLFFDCKFSANAWSRVLKWTKIQWNPRQWNDGLQSKGKSPRAQVMKMALAETLYNVWRFRNESVCRKNWSWQVWRDVCNVVATRCVMELNRFILELDGWLEVASALYNRKRVQLVCVYRVCIAQSVCFSRSCLAWIKWSACINRFGNKIYFVQKKFNKVGPLANCHRYSQGEGLISTKGISSHNFVGKCFPPHTSSERCFFRLLAVLTCLMLTLWGGAT